MSPEAQDSPDHFAQKVEGESKYVKAAEDIFRVPEGKLSTATLKDIEKKILQTGMPKTYEAMTALNEVRAHLEQGKRTKNQMDVKPAYVAGMNKYFSNAVGRYFELLKQYAEKKKQYGLSDDPVLKALETDVVNHVEAFGPLIRNRVRVYRYRALLHHKAEGHATIGSESIDAAIANARGELPIAIERVTPPKPNQSMPQHVSLHAHKIGTSSDMNDAALVQATEILDRDISWFTSTEEIAGKTPGDVKVEEVSPADFLFDALLLTKDTELFERESNVRLKAKSAELEAIRAERKALREEAKKYVKTLGPGQLILAHWHETDRTYEESKPGEVPREKPFTTDQYEKYKQTMDEETARHIGKFRTYFESVLAGKGPLDEKTLDVQAEDIWNKYISPFSLFLAEIYGSISAIPHRLAGKSVDAATNQIGIDIDEDFLANRFRQSILGNLREAFGLPPDFDFSNSENWKKMSPEQRTAIHKKMKEAMASTKDAIRKNRPGIEVTTHAYQHNLALLEDLRKIAHPDSLIGVEPDFEGLTKYLSGNRLDKSILQEKNPSILRAAGQQLTLQLKTDWEEHTIQMHMYCNDLDGIMQTHFNKAIGWEKAIDEWMKAALAITAAYGASYLYGGRGVLARTFPRALRLFGKRSVILRPLNAPIAVAEDIGKGVAKVARKIVSPRGKPPSPPPSTPSRPSPGTGPNTRPTGKLPGTGGALSGGVLMLGDTAAFMKFDRVIDILKLKKITDERERVEKTLAWVQSEEVEEWLNLEDPDTKIMRIRAIDALQTRLTILNAKSHFDISLPEPLAVTGKKTAALEKEYADLKQQHTSLSSSISSLHKQVDPIARKYENAFPIDALIHVDKAGIIKPNRGGAHPFDQDGFLRQSFAQTKVEKPDPLGLNGNLNPIAEDAFLKQLPSEAEKLGRDIVRYLKSLKAYQAATGTLKE